MPAKSHRYFPRGFSDRAADLCPPLGAFELRGLTSDVNGSDRRIGHIEDRRRHGADAGLVVAVAPSQTQRTIRIELGAQLQRRNRRVRRYRPQIEAGVKTIDAIRGRFAKMLRPILVA